MNTALKSTLIVFILSGLLGCAGGGQQRPVSQDARAADINMRLGLSYLQRGEYEVALEKLEKALQQDPGLTTAHNTIALLYQQLGQNEKAEHHFRQAVNRTPQYSEAQNNYGVYLCQQERYQEAEQRFMAAIENPLYQMAAQAYENAGVCALRSGDADKAERYFRQALQIDPELPQALIRMADISYDRQEYLQARAYVQRFQAAAAWTPQSLLTAIKTENKLNDQDAVASYKLVMRARFPDSDEAQQVNRGFYRE
ncbi:type IV pilus biogenesis protein PilF [Methylophaga lonarensis MPL]|uniref:Type IV pilus biogenesis protein PilF n=1 Tax=Methylophaga lonarensis MPL TaxID=1286106 RepID=M7NYV7_9GAMM|nr:type IV pilus biogenesis/stability protein PilW [Methylophaga lonarensis]EMR12391.1 type IV pilus biogenesis protein PilF [Methylophaga lonarensis MPL]